MSWLNWNKPLTPKQRGKVERLIARGHASFILRVGILRWALPVFLLMTAWDYFDAFHAQKFFDASILIISLRLAIWLGAGCLFGEFMWQYYHKLLDRQG
jgi:hypothetical protein